MYLIGVCKAYQNVSSRVIARSRPKTLQVAFYLSESGLELRKITIKSKIKFYFLKYFVKKWKKRKFYCLECGNGYQSLVKGKKIVGECEFCITESL